MLIYGRQSFLKPVSGCAVSCRASCFCYTCCFDTALSLTLVLCLDGSKNGFMNALGLRHLWLFRLESIKVGADAPSGKCVCPGAIAARHFSAFVCFFSSSVAPSGRQKHCRHRLIGRAPLGLLSVRSRHSVRSAVCSHLKSILPDPGLFAPMQKSATNATG